MAKTRRRKKRTHVEDVPDPSKKPDPRTFVFRRGKHANLMADLEMDIRKMMMPNTALNLRESKRNMLRDFVSVAGPLGVTHFIMLTATESSNYMRVAKSPRGPTLALRIKGYSLARDVQSAQARPRAPPNAFQTPPLVVLNGFGGSAGAPQPEHLKLATVLLQAMFPPINVNKVKLSACHRVVLLTHDKNTGMISPQHYSISVAPSGIRKGLKHVHACILTASYVDVAELSELSPSIGQGHLCMWYIAVILCCGGE
ncbi:Brix domain-containing protein [Dunaliella salina]|uniref:Brix domain-containing protein n=1 Tax=Dunaliella salina TaxID=3046 RepID=A0ABQ7GDH7_DUNSA|nr:Brix domain-containing protein [Dunaliella salina]|eukprot:KAF5832660.1 Brix domain-containing protein [Dunaliella salina]